MELMSAEQMGEYQKAQVKLAQKHIDELSEHDIFIEGKVLILGAWHAIHNGTILKAPIPLSSNGKDSGL